MPLLKKRWQQRVQFLKLSRVENFVLFQFELFERFVFFASLVDLEIAHHFQVFEHVFHVAVFGQFFLAQNSRHFAQNVRRVVVTVQQGVVGTLRIVLANEKGPVLT